MDGPEAKRTWDRQRSPPAEGSDDRRQRSAPLLQETRASLLYRKLLRMELRQEQTYPEPTCQQGRGGERWPKTQPLHPITRRIRGAHTGPRNSTRDGRKLGWIGGNLDGEGGGGVLESPKSLGQDPIFLGQALCQDTHLAVPN
jgi:hypothetical protein